MSLVLCYHAVSERWPATLSVAPGQLRIQLETILRRGYKAGTFADVVREPSGSRTMAVTFDDGFRSVHRLAMPIMRELGIPGTLFVPTAYMGGGPMAWPGIEEWRESPYDEELFPCSWDEIVELQEAGWEIGSHTTTHPRLTTISDDALERELSESKSTLEELLGTPCRSMAYPYGDHDDRVVAATGRAGYVAAGTLPARITRTHPLMYPRVFVGHGDNRLRFSAKTARLMMWARRSRFWKLPGGERS